MKETPELLNAASLREAVGNKLSTISVAVHDRVVEHFVERETGKRADAIVRGLEQLSDMDKEIKKIDRPDQKSLDATGKTVNETYSQGRWDQLQKAKAKRQKLMEALDAAIDGDMNKLNSYGKGGGDGDQSKPAAEEA